jgi:hypothetical protein
MEKTITLDQKERQMLAPVEMENLRLHARSDMLRREQDSIDKQLAMNEEQTRGFIRDVVVRHGIETFQNARLMDGGTIMVTLPDESMVLRPNGGIGDGLAKSE